MRTAARNLAALLLAALAGWLCSRPVTFTVPVSVDAPSVKATATVIPIGLGQPTAPPAVFGATPTDSELATGATGAPRLRPGERLLAKLVRHRVSERLQRDGFALIGGDRTPLSAERAAELLANLDDGDVVHVAKSAGVAQGAVLDRLGALLDWLAAHSDEILAVVKLLMQLLILFA